MVIQLPLMLHNIVSKQFKISHVPCQSIAFNVDEIPANIKSLIVDQYSEKYLDDADIVMFFKGKIDKKMRKKLFKAADKALGSEANMLVEQDFHLLKLNKNDEASEFNDENDAEADEESKIDQQIEDIVNEPDEDSDAEQVIDDAEDNSKAVEKALAGESLNEAKDEDDESESDDEEDDDDDEDDEEKKEKDDEDDDDEDASDDEESKKSSKPAGGDKANENPMIPTRYVFLKISFKAKGN